MPAGAHLPPLLPGAEAATAALAAQARAELALLAYPDREWVQPAAASDGQAIDDVLIVGAGQTGLGLCALLRTMGVSRVRVLDRAAPGDEGVWDRFARMPELRTPKRLNGLDLGLPALSVQRWFLVRHGEPAWCAIDRLPRSLWRDYLRWYRETLAIPVENHTEVLDLRPGRGDSGGGGDSDSDDDGAGAWLEVPTRHRGWPRTRRARLVVLATGFDGAGAWRVPAFIAEALPRERYHHSAEQIDFTDLAGKRVAVLGHGASAFDNAVAALEAGAARVDLCFRRERLPRINPHRHIETAGLMSHYAALSDATRWAIARHFRRHDQPPPRASFERALSFPNLVLRAGCPWRRVALSRAEIVIDTPRGPLHTDHVICATGQQIDLGARPELRSLLPLVARWRDRYAPPAGEADEALAALPYLGEHYELQPREPGEGDWLRRVFAFNSLSYVSQGPHSTSISGHKHALPRLARGVTKRLFLDQEAALLPGLEAYADTDIELPDDFETRMTAMASRPATAAPARATR